MHDRSILLLDTLAIDLDRLFQEFAVHNFPHTSKSLLSKVRELQSVEQLDDATCWDQVTEVLEQMELLEHAFLDRQLNNSQRQIIQQMNEQLGGFHSTHFGSREKIPYLQRLQQQVRRYHTGYTGRSMIYHLSDFIELLLICVSLFVVVLFFVFPSYGTFLLPLAALFGASGVLCTVLRWSRSGEGLLLCLGFLGMISRWLVLHA